MNDTGVVRGGVPDWESLSPSAQFDALWRGYSSMYHRSEGHCRCARCLWIDHKDSPDCVCWGCLRAWFRARWSRLTPAEREVELVERFVHRELSHALEFARESWQEGCDSPCLDDQDRDTLRRYLIGRVIRSGGGSAALRLLHRSLEEAWRNAQNTDPDLFEWGPEVLKPGCDYGVATFSVPRDALDDSAWEYLEDHLVSELAEVMSIYYSQLAASEDEDPPVALFVALLVAAAEHHWPTTVHTYPTRCGPEPDLLTPITRTGPPAPTWAHCSQVPSMAA